MEKYFASLISWSSFFINLLVLILLLNDLTNVNVVFLSVSLAACMDMFDGKVARKFCKKKEDFIFGEITDSLCDTINFGIMPVFLFLYFFKANIIISLITSCFYLWAIVFRLARFSRDKNEMVVSYYSGIPVTVAGPISVLLILIFRDYLLVCGAIQISLSFLMISNIKIKKL